jgi:hypothetical protein
MDETICMPNEVDAPVHYVGRRALPIVSNGVPVISLDVLAFEAWKIVLQRDYGGTHRDSPADAAQIAYEYAEAFVARQGAK